MNVTVNNYTNDFDSWEESDFVKNLRKTHCSGCMDEHFPGCNACGVLDCWLRKTYLPPGEWERAIKADVSSKLVNEISDAINNEILNELKRV